MFKLSTSYSPSGDQPQAIEGLVDGLEQGLAKQNLLGVTGSGKTFTIANVIAKVNRTTLVLAHNKTLAAQLYGEFKALFPDNRVEYFVSYYDYYQPEAYVAATDTFIEKDASINEHVEQMRLSATKALFEREDTIIVATVSAIYGLGDPKSYLKMVLHLDVGDRLDQAELLKRLASLQYTRNDQVFERTHFRVRGDVVDVYPADADKTAIRIELFDDQIEGLSTFDPLTGHKINTLSRVTVFPKSHYVTPKETIRAMIDDIQLELKSRLKALRDNDCIVEAARLEQRTQYDIEMMVELGYCSGIENYSRYLSGRKSGEPPPTLMDYLPGNALLVVDESHVTLSQLRAMYRGDRSRKETLVKFGFRLPSAMDNRPLKFEEFEGISPQAIYVSATLGAYELEHGEITHEQLIRPTGLLDPPVTIRPVSSQVDDVLGEIRQQVSKGDRTLITTLTKRMAEDLTAYLSDQGVKVRYLHADIDTVERVEIIRDLRQGVFDVLVGINLLREGLDMPEVSLVAIFDADKEGFLRSSRSLIQTMGRAARHVNGRVILYADHQTDSIKLAIEETQRRRATQMAYNECHGITPKGIEKPIVDVMGAAEHQETLGSVLDDKTYEHLDAQSLAKKIKQLEAKMKSAAKELDFESAAKWRDQLYDVKRRFFKGR